MANPDKPKCITDDAGNRSSMAYDAQGNLVSRSDTTTVGEEYSTTYDAVGNVTSVSGEGQTYRYTFDDANEVTTAGLTGATCTPGGGSQTGCVTFTYDKNGRELQRFFPGNTVVTTTRDKSGRATHMTTITGRTTQFDQSYSYQKAGSTGPTGDRSNIQSMTDAVGVQGSVNHGSTMSYTYDSLNRLTQAVEKTPSGVQNAAWLYTYDKAGNRTLQTRTGNVQAETGDTAYGYNNANELVSQGGSTDHLAYDADGNETAAAGDDWVNVFRRDVTTSPIGDPVHMTTHPSDGDASLDFGYGGANPGQYLLTVAHGTNIPSSPVGVASMTDQTGATVHIMRGPNGKPLAITRGDGEIAFYVPDRLGSIIGLMDTNGTKIVSYAYDPYGNLRSAPGTDANLAWANPLQFTAATRDFPTGLYRMGIRWYDPNTGRFTTPDPTAQEKNAYQYAGGNPCNKTDLDGSDADDTAGKVADWAGAGGAIGAIGGCLLGGAIGGTITGGVGVLAGCMQGGKLLGGVGLAAGTAIGVYRSRG